MRFWSRLGSRLAFAALLAGLSPVTASAGGVGPLPPPPVVHQAAGRPGFPAAPRLIAPPHAAVHAGHGLPAAGFGHGRFHAHGHGAAQLGPRYAPAYLAPDWAAPWASIEPPAIPAPTPQAAPHDVGFPHLAIYNTPPRAGWRARVRTPLRAVVARPAVYRLAHATPIRAGRADRRFRPLN